MLDEPTVAMDVEARRDFWATMRGFTSRGKTVVFATHYLEEADAYADRIILMARGRIVADGAGDRDQGHRRVAHDPGHAARTPIWSRSTRCPASRTPNSTARRC